MSSKKTKDAARAYSDLNIFSAIVALLEGGVVYTRTGCDTAGRIIKFCKEEQLRQLRAFDRAAAASDK